MKKRSEMIEVPCRRFMILATLFCAGCLNAGSAPSYQDKLEAKTEAETAIKAKGSIEKKTYPLGEGNVIDLSGATITDDDIEYLQAVGSVAELNLSGSTITDDQLVNLIAPEENGKRDVAVLFKLDISDTQVSDAGLKALEPLKFLSQLNVKNSRITDAGIKSFEASRKGNAGMRRLKLKIEK